MIKKLFITLACITSPLCAQSESLPHLKIPANSAAANELKTSLNYSELKPGQKILVEITNSTRPAEITTSRAKISTPAPQANALSSLLSYKGKKGAPTSISQAATRSGDKPAIKLTVLSPSDAAITHLAQPRLWWHQDQPSLSRELSFVLSTVPSSGQPGKIIFNRPIPAMPKGFNVIDLSHKAVNPENIQLTSGTTYQWTIELKDGSNSTAAYSKFEYTENIDLASKYLNDPYNKDVINNLTANNNWYELLDIAATLSRRYEENKQYHSSLEAFLTEAGIPLKNR